MKQSKVMILSYAAGFFDGEGYVGIVRHKKGRAKSYEYALVTSFGQKDGAIMDWWKGNFGGGIYLEKKDGSYCWRISNKKAYEFLKIICPFLKYKKPQAELAIRFYQRNIIGNEKRRYLQISEHENQIREEIFNQLKTLKKIYNKCSDSNLSTGAAVTTK